MALGVGNRNGTARPFYTCLDIYLLCPYMNAPYIPSDVYRTHVVRGEGRQTGMTGTHAVVRRPPIPRPSAREVHKQCVGNEQGPAHSCCLSPTWNDSVDTHPSSPGILNICPPSGPPLPPPGRETGPSWGFLHVTLPRRRRVTFLPAQAMMYVASESLPPEEPRPPEITKAVWRQGIGLEARSRNEEPSWHLFWRTAAATGFHMRVLSICGRRNTAVPAGPHLSVPGAEGLHPARFPMGGIVSFCFCDTATYLYIHTWVRGHRPDSPGLICTAAKRAG